MKPAALDVWIWALIYGGLIVFCLGLFLRADVATLGWSAVIGGGLAAAVGVLLVWVRSRMNG